MRHKLENDNEPDKDACGTELHLEGKSNTGSCEKSTTQQNNDMSHSSADAEKMQTNQGSSSLSQTNLITASNSRFNMDSQAYSPRYTDRLTGPKSPAKWSTMRSPTQRTVAVKKIGGKGHKASVIHSRNRSPRILDGIAGVERVPYKGTYGDMGNDGDDEDDEPLFDMEVEEIAGTHYDTGVDSDDSHSVSVMDDTDSLSNMLESLQESTFQERVESYFSQSLTQRRLAEKNAHVKLVKQPTEYMVHEEDEPPVFEQAPPDASNIKTFINNHEQNSTTLTQPRGRHYIPRSKKLSFSGMTRMNSKRTNMKNDNQRIARNKKKTFSMMGIQTDLLENDIEENTLAKKHKKKKKTASVVSNNSSQASSKKSKKSKKAVKIREMTTQTEVTYNPSAVVETVRFCPSRFKHVGKSKTAEQTPVQTSDKQNEDGESETSSVKSLTLSEPTFKVPFPVSDIESAARRTFKHTIFTPPKNPKMQESVQSIGSKTIEKSYADNIPAETLNSNVNTIEDTPKRVTNTLMKGMPLTNSQQNMKDLQNDEGAETDFVHRQSSSEPAIHIDDSRNVPKIGSYSEKTNSAAELPHINKSWQPTNIVETDKTEKFPTEENSPNQCMQSKVLDSDISEADISFSDSVSVVKMSTAGGNISDDSCNDEYDAVSDLSFNRHPLSDSDMSGSEPIKLRIKRLRKGKDPCLICLKSFRSQNNQAKTCRLEHNRESSPVSSVVSRAKSEPVQKKRGRRRKKTTDKNIPSSDPEIFSVFSNDSEPLVTQKPKSKEKRRKKKVSKSPASEVSFAQSEPPLTRARRNQAFSVKLNEKTYEKLDFIKEKRLKISTVSEVKKNGRVRHDSSVISEPVKKRAGRPRKKGKSLPDVNYLTETSQNQEVNSSSDIDIQTDKKFYSPGRKPRSATRKGNNSIAEAKKYVKSLATDNGDSDRKQKGNKKKSKEKNCDTVANMIYAKMKKNRRTRRSSGSPDSITSDPGIDIGGKGKKYTSKRFNLSAFLSSEEQESPNETALSPNGVSNSVKHYPLRCKIVSNKPDKMKPADTECEKVANSKYKIPKKNKSMADVIGEKLFSSWNRKCWNQTEKFPTTKKVDKKCFSSPVLPSDKIIKCREEPKHSKRKRGNLNNKDIFVSPKELGKQHTVQTVGQIRSNRQVPKGRYLRSRVIYDVPMKLRSKYNIGMKFKKRYERGNYLINSKQGRTKSRSFKSTSSKENSAGIKSSSSFDELNSTPQKLLSTNKGKTKQLSVTVPSVISIDPDMTVIENTPENMFQKAPVDLYKHKTAVKAFVKTSHLKLLKEKVNPKRLKRRKKGRILKDNYAIAENVEAQNAILIESDTAVSCTMISSSGSLNYLNSSLSNIEPAPAPKTKKLENQGYKPGNSATTNKEQCQKIKFSAHLLEVWATNLEMVLNSNVDDKKITMNIPVVVLDEISVRLQSNEECHSVKDRAKARKGKPSESDVTELPKVLPEDKGVRENSIMNNQSENYDDEDELPELIKGSTRSRKKKWSSDYDHVYDIPRKLHNFQVPSPCIPELTREDIGENITESMEENIENCFVEDRSLQSVNNNNKYDVCHSEMPTLASKNIESFGKNSLVISNKDSYKINNGYLNDNELNTDLGSLNMDNVTTDDKSHSKGKKRKMASVDKKKKKFKMKSMPKVVLKESKLVVESNKSVSSASPASSPMRDNFGESKSFLPLPFAEPRIVGSSSLNVSAPSFLHVPCRTEQFSFASANRTPKLLMPQGDSNIDFGELSPSPPCLSESPPNDGNDMTLLRSTYASVMVMDNQPQFTTAKVSKSLTEHIQSDVIENQSVKRPDAQRKRTSRVLNDLQKVLKYLQDDKEQSSVSESETAVEDDNVTQNKNKDDTFKPPVNIVPVSDKLRNNTKRNLRRRTRASRQKKEVEENNTKSYTEERLHSKSNEIHTNKTASSFSDFVNDESDTSRQSVETKDIQNRATNFFSNSAETSQVFANYHDKQQQQLHANNKCSEDSTAKNTDLVTNIGNNNKGCQKRKKSAGQKKRKVKRSAAGVLSKKDNNNRLTEIQLKLKKIDALQETSEFKIVFKDTCSAKLLPKSTTSDSLSPISTKYSNPLTVTVNDNTKPVGVTSEHYRSPQVTLASPLEDISTLSEHLAKHCIDDSGQKRWNESAVICIDRPPDSPTSITSKFLDISSDSEYESEHENPVVPLHIIDKNSSSCSSLASPRSTVNPFAPKSWSGDQLSHGESQGENVPHKVRNKRFRKTRSKSSINPEHNGGSDADIDSDNEIVQPPNIFSNSDVKSRTDVIQSAPSSQSIQSPKSQISESLLLPSIQQQDRHRGDNIFSKFAAESVAFQASNPIDQPSQTENNTETIDSSSNVGINPVIDLTDEQILALSPPCGQIGDDDDDNRDSSDYYKSGSENSNASGNNIDEQALDQRLFAFNFVTKDKNGIYQCSLCTGEADPASTSDLCTALHHVIHCHCRCNMCQQSFYEVYAFQGHVWSVHTENNQLMKLSQQFAKYTNAEPCVEPPPLTECVGEIMQLQTFVCLICDRKYAKKSQVKSHVARSHLRKVHALTVLKNRKIQNNKRKAKPSTTRRKSQKSS